MESIPKRDGTEGADRQSSPVPPESTTKRGEPSVRVVSPETLRVIAEVRHPHVVPVRALSNGQGFEAELSGLVAFDRLPGLGNGTSSASLRYRLRVLLDAMSGLAALHSAKQGGKSLGFVHGEVSPRHVVVGGDGLGRMVPIVAGHGTDGKPAPESRGYLAPERLLGDAFDLRADVFSLGVVLWETLSGVRLFGDMPPDTVVARLMGGKVEPPSLPSDAAWASDLADVAMVALFADPAERWANVGTMGAEIEAIGEGYLATSQELAALLKDGRPSLLPLPNPDAQAPRASESGEGQLSQGPMVAWRGPSELGPEGGEDGAPDSEWEGDDWAAADELAPRQSLIVWAAIAAGLLLMGATAYELFATDARSTVTATIAPPDNPPPAPKPVFDPTVAPMSTVAPPRPDKPAAQAQSPAQPATPAAPKQPLAPPPPPPPVSPPPKAATPAPATTPSPPPRAAPVTPAPAPQPKATPLPLPLPPPTPPPMAPAPPKTVQPPPPADPPPKPPDDFGI